MFLINLPIALFLVIFGFLKIEETKPGTSKPMDVVGTMLLSAGILALMYGITELDSTAFIQSFRNPHVLLFLICGIVSLVGLVFYDRLVELLGDDPFIAYILMTTRLCQLTFFLFLLYCGFISVVRL